MGWMSVGLGVIFWGGCWRALLGEAHRWNVETSNVYIPSKRVNFHA